MSMIAPPLVPERSRQDEILHAAARLFAARGFDGVSFRDVTLETGANRSLILYHFHSKEELWRSAMRHIVSKFDAQIAKLPHVAPDRPDSERIANMLRNFLNTLIAVPEYGQVLMREGVHASPRLDWIIHNFVPAITLDFSLSSPAIEAASRKTMRRHVILGTTLFVTALGPLLEGSLAAAKRESNAGVYPLSDERREELVSLLTGILVQG